MRATLTIDPLPGGRPGDKLVTVDCRHGTTTLYALAGPRPTPDAYFVALALGKHRAEQPTCRCITHLERRYLQGAA